MPVAGIGQLRSLLHEFDFVCSFGAAQRLDGGGGGNGGIVHEAGFHEFPSGDAGLSGNQAARGRGEVGCPCHVGIDPAAEKFMVPGVRENHGQLAGSPERRHCMRSEEIEIHERAEEILAPAMAVEQQRVPAGSGNQIGELAAPFSVQYGRHGRSVYLVEFRTEKKTLPVEFFRSRKSTTGGGNSIESRHCEENP